MPSELRYIMFTEKEIAEAAINFISNKSVLVPGMKNSKAKLETMSENSLVISFVKDEFGKRERRVMTSYEIIECLILWCKSKAIALPLSANKDLVQIGKILCMRISMNIPDQNINSVQKLVMTASSKTRAAPAA